VKELLLKMALAILGLLASPVLRQLVKMERLQAAAEWFRQRQLNPWLNQFQSNLIRYYLPVSIEVGVDESTSGVSVTIVPSLGLEDDACGRAMAVIASAAKIKPRIVELRYKFFK
jgi:hypothetical protein